jgi:hypothetical protein
MLVSLAIACLLSVVLAFGWLNEWAHSRTLEADNAELELLLADARHDRDVAEAFAETQIVERDDERGWIGEELAILEDRRDRLIAARDLHPELDHHQYAEHKAILDRQIAELRELAA